MKKKLIGAILVTILILATVSGTVLAGDGPDDDIKAGSGTVRETYAQDEEFENRETYSREIRYELDDESDVPGNWDKAGPVNRVQTGGTVSISVEGRIVSAGNSQVEERYSERESESYRIRTSDRYRERDEEYDDEGEDEEENENENENEDENELEFIGIVEALTTTGIVVDGKPVLINGYTEVEGKLEVGAVVEVEAIVWENTLVAEEIETKSEYAGHPTTEPAPTTLPAAPTDMTATAIGATRVNLSWTDNSNNETGFRIQRATNGSFTSGLVTFYTGAGVTGYSDTSVAASTTYYYRVMAYNSLGDSAPSATSVNTPAVLLSGYMIYASNCNSCHGVNLARGTFMTQTQLANWIPTHHTGSTLTAEEIAALAAYIKS